MDKDYKDCKIKKGSLNDNSSSQLKIGSILQKRQMTKSVSSRNKELYGIKFVTNDHDTISPKKLYYCRFNVMYIQKLIIKL